ncbi:1-phosphatidylinositol 4,5-bisphosphate phosphodiesterase 1 [Golovinomyces cichoracearum]|uniref:Phosphoinositide phospholipase C n=1 Tax=Golovinomyces cichoracearum TaxID=62708 RepID=A0A420H9K3_9PEZI|nr:1-phosphatidylinositol 4,5-bisphosphate phosphodiesterase 1 [Golovinomyces cichoracearum]
MTALSTIDTMTLNNDNQIPRDREGDDEECKEIKRIYPNLSNTLRRHLRGIYDSLRGVEDILSQISFEDWLLTVQKASVDQLEKKEGYAFEDWLGTICVSGFIEAQRDSGPMDLSKPLSNYYISSSHNTYLSGNQLLSKSKTEAYKNVLLRGCRCIEIDVHNGDGFDARPPEENSDVGNNSQDQLQERRGSVPWSSKAATFFNRAGPRLRLWRGHSASSDPKCDEQSHDPEEATLEISPNSSSSSSSSSSLSDSDDNNDFKDRPEVIHGEPIVMHGWTLTAPVGFRAVCKVIGQEAFKVSEYPIIVSLEVHADLEQQEIMLKIMKEEWGEMLVQSAISDCDPNERLPRLEELKKRILVKVKKGQQQTTKNKIIPITNEECGGSLSSKNSKKNKEDPLNHQHGDFASSKPSKKKKVSICENLSKLGIYSHTEHFHSFEDASALKPAHIFSIGESKLIDIVKTQRQALLAHNRDFILRTYPGAKRIGSSNPDPAFFWRQGVQIVAINWQKLDEGMMLNEGMFSGQQGWVLKPAGYRSGDTRKSGKVISVDIETSTKQYHESIELNITVLAAQHIPVPTDTTVKKFFPYVRGELHVEKENIGINNDQRGSTDNSSMSIELKQNTPYIQGDELDFGKKGYLMKFYSRGLIQEELSFFRFKIEDSRYMQDHLAAWACIRLDRLQQGYRLVRLLDTKAQPTQGLLLVKIEKTLRGPISVRD